MSLIKRLLILIAVVVVILGVLNLFTYEVIKVDWLSFMEIQPSFRPMEKPLPVPENSIPVEGAAYIPGMGAPVNPVQADGVSIERGRLLYDVNCALCHGADGKGAGSVAPFLQNQPADLTTESVQTGSDGAVFMVISNGSPGRMPALNENLTVRDRWDVVNYVRTFGP
ncbi:MAG: c-type cytochrome [Chloroflexi bacterium]|nr:c-type cytochrome [Chloroflexota bacterium]